MDIEQPLEGLVDVRFFGGFLHGRQAYMARPEFRMAMELPSGELLCYCRRIVESVNVDGRDVMIATYAPEGLVDDELDRLVLAAARNGVYKVSLD